MKKLGDEGLDDTDGRFCVAPWTGVLTPAE
jgi:hypothetical protein